MIGVLIFITMIAFFFALGAMVLRFLPPSKRPRRARNHMNHGVAPWSGSGGISGWQAAGVVGGLWALHHASQRHHRSERMGHDIEAAQFHAYRAHPMPGLERYQAEQEYLYRRGW
jgi:hypothetical protein